MSVSVSVAWMSREVIRTNFNMATMATLRRVVHLRTNLLRNSLLQASRCLGIRNLSMDVDDHVSGITDEQKQVGKFTQ